VVGLELSIAQVFLAALAVVVEAADQVKIPLVEMVIRHQHLQLKVIMAVLERGLIHLGEVAEVALLLPEIRLL